MIYHFLKELKTVRFANFGHFRIIKILKCHQFSLMLILLKEGIKINNNRIHIRNIDESVITKILNNAKKSNMSGNQYIIALLSNYIKFPDENNIDLKIKNIMDQSFKSIKNNTTIINQIKNGETHE